VTAQSDGKSSFRFDGQSFVGVVLFPKKPFDDWLDALDGWMSRSWIFTSRPIILDFAKTTPAKTDVTELLGRLQARALRIVAVDGVDQSWVAGLSAQSPRNGSVGATSATLESGSAFSLPPADAQDMPHSGKPASLLIERRVRSGEIICYPDGDVTVLGSVSSGAEVIAGGSIHVYGTLRGRAIAGDGNNTSARLFCRRFEPELVAINGLYCTAEEVDPALLTQPVHAWLEGNTINMSIID
jgi:septum site-determining protein MinC